MHAYVYIYIHMYIYIHVYIYIYICHSAVCKGTNFHTCTMNISININRYCIYTYMKHIYTYIFVENNYVYIHIYYDAVCAGAAARSGWSATLQVLLRTWCIVQGWSFHLAKFSKISSTSNFTFKHLVAG